LSFSPRKNGRSLTAQASMSGSPTTGTPTPITNTPPMLPKTQAERTHLETVADVLGLPRVTEPCPGHPADLPVA